LALLIGLNLILVVILGIGDCRLANGYRETIAKHVGPWMTKHQGKFYFSGHWGFQYYSEHVGGEAADETRPPFIGTGDLMIVAATAWPDVLRPQAAAGQTICTTAIHFNPSWFIRTIDCASGANFYASKTYGCSRPTFLPFGFTRGSSETFLVYRVQGSREPSRRDP
jgi:hypothetical protein